MKCREIEELLTAYADGQAQSSERRLALEHLEGCRRCRAHLASLRAMKKAIAGVKAPAIPADLKALLLEKARQAGQRRRPARPLIQWGAMAFAAAATVIVVGVSQERVEVVAVDDLLTAHRQYELTMPLANLDGEPQ